MGNRPTMKDAKSYPAFSVCTNNYTNETKKKVGWLKNIIIRLFDITKEDFK